MLLAAFGCLRASELFGLRRRDVDLLHMKVRVARQLQRLHDQTFYEALPKAERQRTVAIPEQVVDALTLHLDRYVAAGRDALLFTQPNGSPLDISYWNKRWRRARATVAQGDASLPDDLHFHDLRHLGRRSRRPRVLPRRSS